MHGIKNLSLVLLLLLGLTSRVVAQVVDPKNIVIKNVYIASDGAEDVPVNLLIRDNKLELVSQDQIPGGRTFGFAHPGKENRMSERIEKMERTRASILL
jgi:hypothetical protein